MIERGRQAALVAVVTLLVVGSVFALAAAPVAAQEQPNASNASADDDRPDDEPTNVVRQVDEDVRVLNYSYSDADETFFVTLENTGPSTTLVTITETVSADQDGAGSFGVRRVRISGDEKVSVSLDAVRNRGSVGVMITTEKSLERGEGTYLQDSNELDIGLFEGASSWMDVRAAVVGTIVAAIVVLVVGAWYIVRQRDLDIQEVNLGA